MKAESITRQRAKNLRRKLTSAETILWSRLKGRQFMGWHFRKQHPSGKFIADFACVRQRLVIEVDGATHSEEAEITYDRRRTAFMASEGWFVYRIWNNDIYDNLGGVLEGIAAHSPSSTMD